MAPLSNPDNVNERTISFPATGAVGYWVVGAEVIGGFEPKLLSHGLRSFEGAHAVAEPLRR